MSNLLTEHELSCLKPSPNTDIIYSAICKNPRGNILHHLMLDLETLGTGSNSVILSIGANLFSMNSDTSESFYTAIDIQSSLDKGFTIDGGTIAWWLNQSDSARLAVINDPRTISEALTMFKAWIYKYEIVGVWGNGSDFDNVILINAFKKLGFNPPWSYSKHRCFRTLKKMFPLKTEVPRLGTHHNALDDVIYQTNVLKSISAEYNLNIL
mgnify:CR=1 FL=1